jgi:hypothetical protein
MLLRFKTEKDTVTITVDHDKIPKRFQFPLAERLQGADVVQLWNSDKGTTKFFDRDGNPVHIVAKEPTLASLLDAVRDDDMEVAERLHRHCNIAWALAAQMTEKSLKQFDTCRDAVQKLNVKGLAALPIKREDAQ